MKVSRTVFAGFVALLAFQTPVWCDSYTFTPLAPPINDGGEYHPVGINDSQLTEGVFFNYEPWEVATATVTNFTQLPDFNLHNECSTVTNGCFMEGQAINNKGDIAVQRLSYPNNDEGANTTQSQLYFYSKNQWTEVNSPSFNSDPLSHEVFFQGMNQAGQVTATYGHLTEDPRDPGTYFRTMDGSMLWNDGSFTKIVDPNAPANQTMVGGINDSGEIVGSYGSSTTNGFIDQNGIFHQLNYPGAKSTALQWVNDSGQIVGSYLDSSGTNHLFLYSNGKFTAIAVTGDFFVTGFNNQGEVVGYIYPANSSVNGFLYDNGSLQILEYPGSQSTWITGINSEGDLDGYCTDLDSCFNGFIAKPLASATPEPAGFGLLGLGALLCGAALRKLKSRLTIHARQSNSAQTTV